MAKARTNAIIESLRGAIGKDLYARTTKDGRTIISKKPDFGNRQFSEAQLHNQNRTKQAAAYAKVASKENPIYAWRAEGTAMNAYNVAVRDWRRPPVIDSIELDEAGQPLEQGEANLWMSVRWDYQAANRGTVRVEAWDLAGNVTRQEFCAPSYSFLSGRKPARASWHKVFFQALICFCNH